MNSLQILDKGKKSFSIQVRFSHKVREFVNDQMQIKEKFNERLDDLHQMENRRISHFSIH